MSVSVMPLGDLAFEMFTRPKRKPATPEELNAFNGANRRDVQHGSLKLAAWEWGDGPSILLLHGWESRASHMTAFVPELLRRGFRVVAVDAPSHGESEGEITNVVDYGRAVSAVSSQLGPFAGVIAHSVGSAAALYSFAHGVNVKASVHLCGPASLTRVLSRVAAMMKLDETDERRLMLRMSEHLGTSPDVMDLKNLKEGMMHPALILHDAEDREMPVEESRELAMAWHGSTLSILEGVGHRRIIKDASVISSIVEFVETMAQPPKQ